MTRFLAWIYANTDQYRNHVQMAVQYGHPGLQSYQLHDLVREFNAAEDLLRDIDGHISRYCDADNSGEASLREAIAELRAAAAATYVKGVLLGKTQDGQFHIATTGCLPSKDEEVCFDGRRLKVLNTGQIDRGTGRLENFIVCKET